MPIKTKYTESLIYYFNIDAVLSWRNGIKQLISKLSTACYVISFIKPYMPHTPLIMIYCSLFHSVTDCGLIVEGEFFLQL
jgi:hypothetical protein